MIETWKDIPKYEGLYQVSNMGRIKSLKRKTLNGKCLYDKILNNRINHNGYLMIFLSKNKKIKGYRIHRLVAQAFIPNPDNLPQVNHIDKNKTNNRINNLEWCTAKYNTQHAIINKLRDNKYRRKIVQCDLDNNIVKEWNSIKEATDFGFSKSGIWQCCNNKRNMHKNYKWYYKEVYYNEFNFKKNRKK